MVILGIETSCDETGAAVVEADALHKKVNLLSNIVSSSISLHKKTGGIIPEVAAREQIRFIIPVIEQALKKAKLKPSELDAIAVTVGPGLIGSLLVGVETAKSLAYAWNKPIIPVNHLIGHIYANFITTELNARRYTLDPSIEFPAIALIVSGGHTDIVLIRGHGDIKWLGGTRDDAAGEALDKIGRLLNLPYPGGPVIEKLSKDGNPNAYNFPRPLIDSKDFDFSFSGLKTAVMGHVILSKTKNLRDPSSPKATQDDIRNICASVQQAVIDVLTKKTLQGAKQFKAKSVLLGGGVAANQTFRDRFELEIGNLKLEIPFFVPEKWLCTDNAAMIAAGAFFNYTEIPWKKITANPQLYFD